MSPVPRVSQRSHRREPLSAGVRRRLITAILDGQLVAGERLHDDELTAWLGVSRTPIRTALERLTEIGLIESAPNRFTRVARPTPESHRAVLDVHEALHAAVAESVVPSLSDDDVVILSDLVEVLDRLLDASPNAVWTREQLGAMGAVTSFFSRRCANPSLIAAVAEVDLRLAFSLVALGVRVDRAAAVRCAAGVLDSARARDASVFVSATRAFAASGALGVGADY